MAAGTPERGQWGSRLGFILAAVGSAVGLGNMWRFPYQMSENGGAAFLMLYILMMVLIGLPIMLAEFSVGRGARRSPVEALAFFGGPRWKALGVLFVVAGFMILAYYGVIAGWVLRYTGAYVLTGVIDDPGGTFGAYATGPIAVVMQIVFMLATIAIVIGGVQRGIERASLLLMPLLFLIVAGLAVWAAFLPGAGAGYSYYFETDFREILDFGVLTSAAGQAFFSLSLGMGAMLTYSSYLSRQDDLPQEAGIIGGADFLVAFVAGLMIFPLVFALGLQADVGESTVGALFITLPQAFAQMGDVTGRIVGLLFFSALLVGALTSAISLLEVVTSTAIDTLGWTRRKATLIMGAAITLVGVPCAIDLNFLTIYDEIAGEVFLVIGALFIAIFVGWRMPDPVGEVRKGSRFPAILPPWRALLRYIVPPLLVVVLLFQLVSASQAIYGVFAGGDEGTEAVEDLPAIEESPRMDEPAEELGLD
jgi:neurotransmitter:Na+ symporter, NSS family